MTQGESNNKENDQRHKLFFQKIISKSILSGKTHQGKKERKYIFSKLKIKKRTKVKTHQIQKTKR